MQASYDRYQWFKYTETCIERISGLERAANILPLVQVFAYYSIFVSLFVPGVIKGPILRSLFYGLLLCLSFAVTVGIYHLHAHRRLFGYRDRRRSSLRQKICNRVLELLLTFPALGTLSDFEIFHIGHHHRHNNSEFDYSSTGGKEHGWRAIWYWLTFAVIVRYHVLRNLYAKRAPALPRRLRRHRILIIFDIAINVVVIVALSIIWPKQTLVYWLVPSIFTALNTGYFSWITHAPAEPNGSVNGSINTVNNVMNLLIFNQGYHAIHHLYPGIHWSDIPEKLGELLIVEENFIVPYWVTLPSAWRICLPNGFVNPVFGRRWKARLQAILESGSEPRLKLLPYFAWV